MINACIMWSSVLLIPVQAIHTITAAVPHKHWKCKREFIIYQPLLQSIIQYMWPSTTKWVVMCQMAIFTVLFLKYFLKVNSMLFTMVKTIFKSGGLVAELHVFEYGVTAFGTFEKTCFKCWRLLCKNNRAALKNHVFDHETWKVNYFHVTD